MLTYTLNKKRKIRIKIVDCVCIDYFLHNTIYRFLINFDVIRVYKISCYFNLFFINNFYPLLL